MPQPTNKVAEVAHRLRTIQSILTNEIEYLSIRSEVDLSLLNAANNKLSVEIELLDSISTAQENIHLPLPFLDEPPHG